MTSGMLEYLQEWTSACAGCYGSSCLVANKHGIFCCYSAEVLKITTISDFCATPNVLKQSRSNAVLRISPSLKQ